MKKEELNVEQLEFLKALLDDLQIKDIKISDIMNIVNNNGSLTSTSNGQQTIKSKGKVLEISKESDFLITTSFIKNQKTFDINIIWKNNIIETPFTFVKIDIDQEDVTFDIGVTNKIDRLIEGIEETKELENSSSFRYRINYLYSTNRQQGLIKYNNTLKYIEENQLGENYLSMHCEKGCSNEISLIKTPEDLDTAKETFFNHESTSKPLRTVKEQLENKFPNIYKFLKNNSKLEEKDIFNCKKEYIYK